MTKSPSIIQQQAAFSRNAVDNAKSTCQHFPLLPLAYPHITLLQLHSQGAYPLFLTYNVSPHWRLQPEALAVCSTLPECLSAEHRSQGTELLCLDTVHFQKEKNPSSQFPSHEGPLQSVSNQLLHHGILCKRRQKFVSIQILIHD